MFNEFLHVCMNKLSFKEDIHFINAEKTKEAWEKFVEDSEAKKAAAPPAPAGAAGGLLGGMLGGGGAGGAPNPMATLKLKMEFSLRQKVAEQMKVIDTKREFRKKIIHMKENELDGFTHETLTNCIDILNPYLIGEKK